MFPIKKTTTSLYVLFISSLNFTGNANDDRHRQFQKITLVLSADIAAICALSLNLTKMVQRAFDEKSGTL
jgi:hypothetical protein